MPNTATVKKKRRKRRKRKMPERVMITIAESRPQY